MGESSTPPLSSPAAWGIVREWATHTIPDPLRSITIPSAVSMEIQLSAE